MLPGIPVRWGSIASSSDLLGVTARASLVAPMFRTRLLRGGNKEADSTPGERRPRAVSTLLLFQLRRCYIRPTLPASPWLLASLWCQTLRQTSRRSRPASDALRAFTLLDASVRASLSVPELLGGEPGALHQGGKLQPRHAGVGVVKPHGGGGKPTISSGDDVLAPHKLGKPHDPFGH
jgi:hypothetical protein